MCPCPLALSKDVVVKCYWCASTDDAMSGWNMFAATSPAGSAGSK